MSATSVARGYPENWSEISLLVRARSGGRCECEGECGLHRERRCCEQNGEPAVFARGSIALTVAHLDHNPGNNAFGHSVVQGPGLRCRGCGWAGGLPFLAADGSCPECQATSLAQTPNNLKAMCQRCHLLYDLELHMLHRLRNEGALEGARERANRYTFDPMSEPELRALALRLHEERVEAYRAQMKLSLRPA